MTVTIHRIVAKCDACRVTREIENEDGLSFGSVTYHLELDGWYIPSLGKTLCPNCRRNIEYKTGKPLEPEIERPHEIRDTAQL